MEKKEQVTLAESWAESSRSTAIAIMGGTSYLNSHNPTRVGVRVKVRVRVMVRVRVRAPPDLILIILHDVCIPELTFHRPRPRCGRV